MNNAITTIAGMAFALDDTAASILRSFLTKRPGLGDQGVVAAMIWFKRPQDIGPGFTFAEVTTKHAAAFDWFLFESQRIYIAITNQRVAHLRGECLSLFDERLCPIKR